MFYHRLCFYQHLHSNKHRLLIFTWMSYLWLQNGVNAQEKVTVKNPRAVNTIGCSAELCVLVWVMSLVALLLECRSSPFPDRDDCSLQDAIWILSCAITVPRKGRDGLRAALCGCGSKWSECRSWWVLCKLVFHCSAFYCGSQTFASYSFCCHLISL